MLEEYIKSNNCFKLILGANNENYEEITKLTALYSLAGCSFFDINASSQAISACKKGLEYSKKEGYICISIGTKNDPHLSKCKINNKKCLNCQKCLDKCIQNAIAVKNDKIEIDEKKCIGCKRCYLACLNKAIDIYQSKADFKKVVNETKKDADCIEFHIITPDKKEIFKKWKYLKDYDGYLSIALNRDIFSNKETEEILFKMLEIRENKVMIQADGAPMSGGKDDYNTTLQAVSMADIIRKAGIKVPILVSGGTNSKTIKLANLCNIDIQGVAIGSWARKQVREFIDSEDFFENKDVFNKALNIAKAVVDSTKH